MLLIQSLETLDSIKVAIQCEIDMKNFYEKLAGLAGTDDAIAILRGLAEKEDKHRLKLIRIYTKHCGKKILYLNLGRKHKLNSLQSCSDDAETALEIAKRNENEIKNYYVAVSRRLYEPDLKQIFRDLAQEEEQHIALLESSFIEPLGQHENAANSKRSIYAEYSSIHKNSVNTW